jgi:hypothetical protein
MTDLKTPSVGFMNPPKHTRFKKGKSGNPSGRPRKPKDINTVLHQVLNRKISIRDEERRIPIRDALIWKLRELALQGDKQALSLQRRIIEEAGLAQSHFHSVAEKKEQVRIMFENMGIKAARSAGKK